MSRLDDLDLTAGSKTSLSVDLPAGDPKTDDPLARARTLAADDSPGLPELENLPLGVGRGESASPLSAASGAAPAGTSPPLSARGAAFAADAALVLLLAAAALLAATAGRGQALRLQGLGWTAVFALYLSFFSTVVALVLFGKTVGMALTGLTARGASGAALTAAESSRRWLGTLLTLASLGIALVATRRDREAPSLADKLSGRPLAWERL